MALVKVSSIANVFYDTVMGSPGSFRNSQRIAMYGASVTAKAIAPILLSQRHEVAYIVDRKTSLHGKTFEGIPVAPQEMLHKDRVDYIVVSSSIGRPYNSIAANLRGMGFKERLDFDHYSVLLAPTMIKNNIRDFSFKLTAIQKLIKSNRIALYGVTDRARLLARTLRSFALNVELFVDNASDLHGKSVDGLIIEPPERLLRGDIDYIIVSSEEEYPVISTKLSDFGFKEPDNFIDYRLVMAHTFF